MKTTVGRDNGNGKLRIQNPKSGDHGGENENESAWERKKEVGA